MHYCISFLCAFAEDETPEEVDEPEEEPEPQVTEPENELEPEDGK